MKDFFEGIANLGFWQWVGLLMLAQAIRGNSLVSIRRGGK